MALLTTGAGAPYIPSGVNFNGSTYLSVTGTPPLTGLTDSKAGTISFWLKMRGGDAAFHYIFNLTDVTGGGATTYFVAYRHSSNKLSLFARNSVPATIIDVTSTSTYVNGMNWTHVIWSWDLAATTVLLYVNGANDRAAGGTVTNANIAWASLPDTGILGVSDTSLSDILNADVADLWFNDAFLDLTTASNVQKFRSANGRPAYLGADGSVPTGSAPKAFFSGAVGSWATNKGSGGGYTVSAGSLSASSTNPPLL